MIAIYQVDVQGKGSTGMFQLQETCLAKQCMKTWLFWLGVKSWCSFLIEQYIYCLTSNSLLYLYSRVKINHKKKWTLISSRMGSGYRVWCRRWSCQSVKHSDCLQGRITSTLWFLPWPCLCIKQSIKYLYCLTMNPIIIIAFIWGSFKFWIHLWVS